MADGNKPTHDLCVVFGEGRGAIWTRVAALWPTKDGEGFTGEIPQALRSRAALLFQKRKGNDEASE